MRSNRPSLAHARRDARRDGVRRRRAGRRREERGRAGRGFPRCARALWIVLLLLAAAPAPAQFLPFGRNKISYDAFRWQVLKTEHFDIYSYVEMEELARKGATLAEESYRALEQRFCYTVRHRIPLVFYSSPIHFQQTNITSGFIPEGVGGFFEFLKGRVVIPASGSLPQFRHVIRHELVHVFMHNKVEDAQHEHGQPAEKYPPLWFTEGLAEYFSTEWDSQAEMLLRDAVINGYVVPIGQIWAISGSFLMYKEGQSALTFMAEEYGRESIVRCIDNVWRTNDFGEIMRLVTGAGEEEFDRAWMRWLRRRYFPLVAGKERPSDASLPVVPAGFTMKPVCYRDGDSDAVAFMANATGYAGVYRVPLAAAAPGGAPEDAVGSGREAVAGAGRAAPDTEPLLLLEGETSDELETFHLQQGRMAVLGDTLLAFVTKSGESDVVHLFDLRARRIRRTLAFEGLTAIGSVSWSPDGAALAFSAIDAAGRSDIYRAGLSDGRAEPLTQDAYDDRDPAWSPDGASIAFVSDRGSRGERGVYSLYLLDAERGALRSLLCEPWSCASPAWSPDGKALLFTGDRDGTHDVFLLDFRGVPSSPSAAPVREAPVREAPVLRRVTTLLTAAFDPSWSSSGDVVFSAFDRYSFQIRRLAGVGRRLDSLPAIPYARYDEGDARAGGAEAWDIRPWTGTAASAALRYEKEYQLDIAQSQISTDPVFGTMGGASISLSDMLGNDRYYFLLYNTAQTSDEFLSSWNLAISHVSTERRTPFAYGIYNFTGRRYDLLDPDLYFQERAYGGYLAAAYPFSRFERVEGNVSITSSDKEALYDIRQRKALLLTNSVSYVRDNALYYYTGPIDGMRCNVTLALTTDVQYSNVNYFSAMADYRRYLRLGRRSAVALRAELLYNHGREARRYFLGGSWDLRGWGRWSIRGTKRWLASCELRFPLLDRVGLDFPFGSMDLGILRGALFADAGNAWDEAYDETRGAIGAGLRLGLFGALVLRYDFGKRIEGNFSRLQDGLFQQFFFGWDF